jgi:hypothetical protein
MSIASLVMMKPSRHIVAMNYSVLFVVASQEKDVCMSEFKKIFLSHKTIDKALVIDFKEALAAIGYDLG